jgi:hypothetical protein
MSDNANQPNSRVGSENSGNGGHFDQGGRRYNQSGNRNNRRRRPSQQIGGEQPDNHSKRPTENYPGNAVHQNVQPNAQPDGVHSAQPVSQTGKNQNTSARPDSFGSKRNNNNNSNNRAQRQNQDANVNTAQTAVRTASPGVSQGSAHGADKPDNQAFVNRKNTIPQTSKTDRPREPRTWGRNIRAEETHEDVHRENERIEKEIWLEIASIHTYKLD